LVADPESLPTMQEQFAPYRDKFGPDFAEWSQRERPIDSRPTEVPSWLDHRPRPPAQDVWIRANGVLPDDFLIWCDGDYSYVDYVFRGVARAAKLVEPPVGIRDLG